MMPVTQSQSMIWAGQALAPDAALYNMVWRFDIDGNLDPDRFAAAFLSVATASDALSTGFVETAPGRIEAVPLSGPPALDAVLDLVGAPDPEAAAAAFIGEDGGRPLDLATGSFRTRLVRLGPERWIWYLVQHHIATDAWSGQVLFRSVSEAYLGQHPTLPAFRDYAEAEAAALQDGSLAAAREHWTQRQESYRAATPPYGASRNGAAPASHRRRLDLVARGIGLRALANQPPFRSLSPDLSIFAILATLYAAYLARVTGDRVVRIGAPAHNRLNAAHKATIGLFIEMYPLEIAIEEGDSFTSLHKRVMAEAFAYLRHARPGASTPATASLFNAVLNYIPIVFGDFAGLPTRTRWLHAGAHDSRHDLRLHVYSFNDADEFIAEIDFNDTVFDAVSADAACAHFLALWDALLDNPDLPVEAVALPTALKTLKGPPGSLADPVLERFRAMVAAEPEATALRQEDTRVSYRDLDQLSDAFAARFQAAGLAPGDSVALHANRSAGLVAAMLGAQKAGGAFAPIPADAPPHRVAAILKQLSPALILADPELIGQHSGADVEVIDLAIAPEPAAPSPVTATPADAAYIIFTSGTTGEPKGVVIEQDGLARYINWAESVFGTAGPKDYPFYSSIGFDLTITSLFVPLVTGGAVHIYPAPANGPDLSVLQVFDDDAVDVVKLTPSHLALVTAQRRPLQRIRTLILGGEALTTALARRARAMLSPDLVIANEYGPTEAVVGCMIHRFDPARDLGDTVPIGRPADDVTIELRDAGGNPVPEGVVGEIAIGGARLARGYLGQPDLTAVQFCHDAQGRRHYLSGDLGRLRRDGVLEYLGRRDAQLKLSGVRLEPGEIEAALLHHPEIAAAHVSLQGARPAHVEDDRNCRLCGLSARYPEADLDDRGVCGICRDFADYKARADVYFETPEVLGDLLADAAARKTGHYDAVMLLSGGKDSTYALYRLAAITRNILTVTLDNGFLSDGAMENIRRVTDDLGVEHRFLRTPAMNEIFRDSLKRHSNVCQGCFKTIYALALKVARDEGIPAIVTGLSRGQFFETRLTPDLFRNQAPGKADIEGMVDDARRAYHKADDAVRRLLDTDRFVTDETLEAIRFIDIYRYIDVPVAEIYRFLAAHVPWARPGDTGRSSNCLINDVGIYVHQRREGFHNYALPYSWDVRMGHKTREQALEELNDAIDPAKVHRILDKIGFDEEIVPADKPRLVAHIVADAGLSDTDLRAHLSARLPRAQIPAAFVRMDALPLTSNGKVDAAALPAPDFHRAADTRPEIAPATALETRLSEIFISVLGRDGIGVTDNFYDAGGDSIAAIQIAIAATDAGLPMQPAAVFEHQSIRALAASLATGTEARAQTPADAPLIDLGVQDLAAVARALSGTASSG